MILQFPFHFELQSACLYQSMPNQLLSEILNYISAAWCVMVPLWMTLTNNLLDKWWKRESTDILSLTAEVFMFHAHTHLMNDRVRDK